MTSTIKVNNIQNQCGQNIINENSNTITLGASGDTIALASGASQTGFGREGSVDWQTGSIKTSTFTAVNGQGFFVDTSSGAVTANLPAGSAGAIVAFADYTRTFGTNKLTISPNGSEKIGGLAADANLNVNGQAATFVYVDATEGWINVQNVEDSETGASFITATGGTITCCGNFKIHTFTSPGTFCVSSISGNPANNEVSYLVIAGGGGGGNTAPQGVASGGGGAGGYREKKSSIDTYSASPKAGGCAMTITAAPFPITVGAGAAANSGGFDKGNNGNPSVFNGITSAGGGGGTSYAQPPGGPGGSGGGGGDFPHPSNPTPGGAGNTPPTTPPQGSNGGPGAGAPQSTNTAGGGGGGASAVGATASSGSGGNGGAGVATSITGSPVTRAGGGGGGGSSVGSGGSGGGGAGKPHSPGQTGGAGTVNTGSGGGGTAAPDSGCNPQSNGGTGGSGIVVIRYKFQ